LVLFFFKNIVFYFILFLQFNVNSFALLPPPGCLNGVPALAPGQSFDISVLVPATGSKTPGPFGDMLQIAIKHSGGQSPKKVFFFKKSDSF
jgi:hypothetical protein